MASRLTSGVDDVEGCGAAARVFGAGLGTTVDGLEAVAMAGVDEAGFDTGGVCAIGRGAVELCTAALRAAELCAVATCAAGF
jgi:hypothetical protein